ncbi:hypothetical protein IC229_06085 [Spirosoma sp. BT702]|uniref:DUF1579 domain-containing protein n=1 Tax=Spirosoma profusum TaxID=2771354 RepID=A0A926XUV4_9BACT|nr:hypothetical protein [Spirosoma profusum]MBD2700195.1 hypothetical protein [Spirosoma profusum]
MKTLEPLIGKWKLTGDDLAGEVTFEWMEGGFFMIQRFDLVQAGRHEKGIEYTGFDEETQTLRSRLMQTNGSNFTYTYQIEGNEFWYWFGYKGSDNYSKSTFSADGNSYSGRWQWSLENGEAGGYSYVATRIE